MNLKELLDAAREVDGVVVIRVGEMDINVAPAEDGGVAITAKNVSSGASIITVVNPSLGVIFGRLSG